MPTDEAGSAPATDGGESAQGQSEALSTGSTAPNEQSSGAEVNQADANAQGDDLGSSPDGSDPNAESSEQSPGERLLAEANELLSGLNPINQGFGSGGYQNQLGQFGFLNGHAANQNTNQGGNQAQAGEFKYAPLIDAKSFETIKTSYPELEGVFSAFEKDREQSHRDRHEFNQSITKDRQTLDQINAFYGEQRTQQARASLDPIIDSLGNEALYGTKDNLHPAGARMRSELCQRASVLQQNAAQRGVQMQDGHALALANAILTGQKNAGTTKAAATKKIESQIVNNSGQRRIAPGARVQGQKPAVNGVERAGSVVDNWIQNGRNK